MPVRNYGTANNKLDDNELDDNELDDSEDRDLDVEATDALGKVSAVGGLTGNPLMRAMLPFFQRAFAQLKSPTRAPEEAFQRVIKSLQGALPSILREPYPVDVSAPSIEAATLAAKARAAADALKALKDLQPRLEALPPISPPQIPTPPRLPLPPPTQTARVPREAAALRVLAGLIAPEVAGIAYLAQTQDALDAAKREHDERVNLFNLAAQEVERDIRVALEAENQRRQYENQVLQRAIQENAYRVDEYNRIAPLVREAVQTQSLSSTLSPILQRGQEIAQRQEQYKQTENLYKWMLPTAVDLLGNFEKVLTSGATLPNLGQLTTALGKALTFPIDVARKKAQAAEAGYKVKQTKQEIWIAREQERRAQAEEARKQEKHNLDMYLGNLDALLKQQQGGQNAVRLITEMVPTYLQPYKDDVDRALSLYREAFNKYMTQVPSPDITTMYKKSGALYVDALKRYQAAYDKMLRRINNVLRENGFAPLSLTALESMSGMPVSTYPGVRIRSIKPVTGKPAQKKR